MNSAINLVCCRFYIKLATKISKFMNTGKQQIIDLAKVNRVITANLLEHSYGMNPVTARQYLSSLAKVNELVRIGQGEYTLPDKQTFGYSPSEKVKGIYDSLKSELPFTDFCIYDGSILSSLQHHLSVNHAVYVETNRDAVDSVFALLRKHYKDVFRRPDSVFMYEYVDLRNECIIVKTLVTEAPLMTVGEVRVPTLEKLLVDTQKDDDFDYLRGSESQYIYQMAFDLYNINKQRLMRYARRRGVSKEIQELLNQLDND